MNKEEREALLPFCSDEFKNYLARKAHINLIFYAKEDIKSARLMNSFQRTENPGFPVRRCATRASPRVYNTTKSSLIIVNIDLFDVRGAEAAVPVIARILCSLRTGSPGTFGITLY